MSGLSEDIRGGKKIHEQIQEATEAYDKLLLVLSEDSLSSEWIRTEIRKARKVERKESRRKLFPIRLVDLETLREWSLSTQIAEMTWESRFASTTSPISLTGKPRLLEAALAELLKDLRAEESTEVMPG